MSVVESHACLWYVLTDRNCVLGHYQDLLLTKSNHPQVTFQQDGALLCNENGVRASANENFPDWCIE